MSSLGRLATGTAGLLLVFFTLPLAVEENVVFRALGTVAGLALATVVIVQQVRHQWRSEGSPLWGLGLAVVGGLLAFALADYVIAVNQPGEFVGLSTRLDALYFALTTLATVGYGDIHAQGQLARGVVSVQLAFNILVLATAGSVLATQLRSRRRT
jgi:voltage-gated potassium channel